MTPDSARRRPMTTPPRPTYIVHLHLHATLTDDQYAEILDALAGITPRLQPFPPDAAQLDITGALRYFGKTADDMVHMIAMRLAGLFGVRTSAGLAPNRMLAAMAAAAGPPGHTTRVPHDPQGITTWLHPHPVTALPGIGRATADTLHRYGLTTIGDVADLPPPPSNASSAPPPPACSPNAPTATTPAPSPPTRRPAPDRPPPRRTRHPRPRPAPPRRPPPHRRTRHQPARRRPHHRPPHPHPPLRRPLHHHPDPHPARTHRPHPRPRHRRPDPPALPRPATRPRPRLHPARRPAPPRHRRPPPALPRRRRPPRPSRRTGRGPRPPPLRPARGPPRRPRRPRTPPPHGRPTPATSLMSQARGLSRHEG